MITNENNGLCGLDEAGRGALAGPVVAVAAILWGDLKAGFSQLEKWQITDSKQLNPIQRQEKLSRLGLSMEDFLGRFPWRGKLTSKTWLALSVGQSSVERIEKINILKASLEAMEKAFEGLPQESPSPDRILVDGHRLPPSWEKNPRATAIIRGDQQSLIIGLASIAAKEYRDALMIKLDQKWPHYGLAQHKGYPTSQHKEAIKRLGISPCHRKTFRGCRQ